jgi:protoporphyrinogen IX oxidase
MLLLWLKAFHIFGVISWFAGILYLPRLFVYHADTRDQLGNERFKIMERRLFAMMTIGAVLTIAFGISIVAVAPGFLAFGWLQVKLALVALLIGYHVWCYRLMIAFREDRNARTSKWYRVFNDMPTLALIAILILVVVKPF